MIVPENNINLLNRNFKWTLKLSSKKVYWNQIGDCYHTKPSLMSYSLRLRTHFSCWKCTTSSTHTQPNTFESFSLDPLILVEFVRFMLLKSSKSNFDHMFNFDFMMQSYNTQDDDQISTWATLLQKQSMHVSSAPCIIT